MRTLCIAVLASLALLSHAAPPPSSTRNWYMEIQGVTGCADAQGHTGWVEVSGLHHLWHRNEGLNQPPQVAALVLSKNLDCASVQLWQGFQSSTQYGIVNLEAVADDGSNRLLQRIELQNVRIGSIETSDLSPDYSPLERIRLTYRRINMISYCYDQQGESCGDYQYQHDFQSSP